MDHCLAGLLLGGYNILVLDEPGNHLDVETVMKYGSSDASIFCHALCLYAGTVIFEKLNVSKKFDMTGLL